MAAEIHCLNGAPSFAIFIIYWLVIIQSLMVLAIILHPMHILRHTLKRRKREWMNTWCMGFIYYCLYRWTRKLLQTIESADTACRRTRIMDVIVSVHVLGFSLYLHYGSKTSVPKPMNLCHCDNKFCRCCQWQEVYHALTHKQFLTNSQNCIHVEIVVPHKTANKLRKMSMPYE